MYEIIFHYHEKVDGKFDMENKKTFSKKIGTKADDVPIEKVAAAILGQLAKRSIYVSDVQVFEFVKREIAYRETQSGIVIKGKKFKFDQLASEITGVDECPVEECQEAEEQEFPPIIDVVTGQEAEPIVPKRQAIQPKPKPRDSNVPIRYEVFRPCREDYAMTQKQGIKLSMSKNYPIFRETIGSVASPYGEQPILFYTVADDQGQKIDVISTYFEPMPRGLSHVGVQMQRPQEGRLSYVDTSPISSGAESLDAMIARQDSILSRRV